MDVPEITPAAGLSAGQGEAAARSGADRRVIWLEIVQEPEPAPEPVVEPEVEPVAAGPRPALKRNGDARTLTDALHAAGGGAERVQLQVIRERLSGLEARAADAQTMLRRQAPILQRIKLVLYVTMAVAVVCAVAAVAALFG